jgi:hypothetical protein
LNEEDVVINTQETLGKSRNEVKEDEKRKEGFSIGGGIYIGRKFKRKEKI